MPDDKLYPGGFEEIVLLALVRLGSNAYGVTIRQTVADAMQKEISIGAIYTTLDRLEKKGFISSCQGEPTPERGGRAKKYFQIEGTGMQALKEAQRVRAALQAGLKRVGGVI